MSIQVVCLALGLTRRTTLESYDTIELENGLIGTVQYDMIQNNIIQATDSWDSTTVKTIYCEPLITNLRCLISLQFVLHLLLYLQYLTPTIHG